jgi:hypothetical protein
MGRASYREETVNLKDLFYIDAEGFLRWKRRWGRMLKDSLAGCVYGGVHLVKIRGEWYPTESIVNLIKII